MYAVVLGRRESFSYLEGKIEKPSVLLTMRPEYLAAAFTLEGRWASSGAAWGSRAQPWGQTLGCI